MLHEEEKANLQRTLERTRAALGVLAALEGELRTIRKGMAPTADKARIQELIRLNRETLAGLDRKISWLEHELSQQQNPPRNGASRPMSPANR